MLHLLLDIHISPQVAVQVIGHRPGCAITSLRNWQNGKYRTAPDAVILEAARDNAMTLVTYDRRTISPLLQE